MDEYDAVVAGGSIAGCTAATFLGRQGARVALLERSPNEDAYKVICTHAIMPCATGTLRRLGLVEQIEAAGGLRNAADIWTRRGWVRPRPAAGVKELPYGYNIRRERLDPMIRSLAASTEGVDYLPGANELPQFREDLEGAFVRYFADLPEGPDLSAAVSGWRRSSMARSHRTGMSTVRWTGTAGVTGGRWPCITG